MALKFLKRRAPQVGFFESQGAHLAASITSTSSVPSSRVRRQAYTPGGLSNLSSPGHHPYWRGGNLRQSWANEDDPGAHALFYTAADLHQTDDGRVFYDGEDDAAAVGAFEFLKKLFRKKEAPAGVAPPTELRRGTGGPGAVPLAAPLGVDTRWVKHELAPGLQIRLRKGTKVAVANVGTADAPIWQISMGVRNPETGAFDGSGVVPLLLMALQGGSAAASRKAAKNAAAKAAQGQDLDGGPLSLAPGASTQLGGVDLLGSIFGQDGATSEGVSDVQVGALMIDSDGRRIEI